MAYTATAEIIPARPLMLASSPTFTKDLFARFIDYTDRKETTVKGYISCIRQFARWMEQNGIETPTRADIKAYRDYLNESELAPGTRFQYLRAVKHFFKWTAAEGLFPNVADNIHGVKVINDCHRKDAVPRNKALKIANTIDRSSLKGKRLYAMYMLSTVDTLRLIELHRANVGDIKIIDGDPFLYVQQKGHDEKDSPKYLVPDIKEAIYDYLAARTDKYTNKSPLFVSTGNRAKPGAFKGYKTDAQGNYILNSKGEKIKEYSDGRISVTTMSTMIKKVLVDAGYVSDRITAHSGTRATGITAGFEAGLSLYDCQHMAGHRSADTTLIYIKDQNDLQTEKKTRTKKYKYLKGETTNEILPELESAIMELTPEEQRKLLELIKKGNF